LGVPQGGVLSPILANLYLTPLDEFIDKLKKKYTDEPISKRNVEYRKIESQIGNLRKKLQRTNPNGIPRPIEEVNYLIENLSKLNVKLRNMPSTIRIGRKIHYVRYADD
jgi:retron-type reverse transcriptase